MARPKIRLGTVGLLILIIALCLALVVQWRREMGLRKQLVALEQQARIAELQAVRARVFVVVAAERWRKSLEGSGAPAAKGGRGEAKATP